MSQNKQEEKNSWITKDIKKEGSYTPYTEKAYKLILNKTLRDHAIPKGALILDAGCSTGALSNIISSCGYNVIGIDIAKEATLRAKEISDDNKDSSIYITGDIECLPFAGSSFDACICLGVLHHFVKLDRVAKELERVTKKGGRIFAIEPNALNPHTFLAMHKKSPIRYDKLTSNERPLYPNELSENFGGENMVDFAFIQSKVKGGGNRIYDKIIGFIIRQVYGFWRMVLAVILFNMAHIISAFLPAKHKSNYIIFSSKID